MVNAGRLIWLICTILSNDNCVILSICHHGHFSCFLIYTFKQDWLSLFELIFYIISTFLTLKYEYKIYKWILIMCLYKDITLLHSMCYVINRELIDLILLHITAAHLTTHSAMQCSFPGYWLYNYHENTSNLHIIPHKIYRSMFWYH